MRVAAKADYAVRACAELASRTGGESVSSEVLAAGQDIPTSFLERIMGDLRRGGVVTSVRGRAGGYLLARPAEEITVADVIRAVDGPLVTVRDVRPPGLTYEGSATALLEVWVALRASVRDVLDVVTLADVVRRELPESVHRLAAREDSWQNP